MNTMHEFEFPSSMLGKAKSLSNRIPNARLLLRDGRCIVSFSESKVGEIRERQYAAIRELHFIADKAHYRKVVTE